MALCNSYSKAMNSFADVVNAWGTAANFATALKIPYPTAAAWRARNSIPANRWRDVVEAAERDGKAITVDLLTDLAARNPEPTPAREGQAA